MRKKRLTTDETVVWTDQTSWEAAVRQAEQEEVLVLRDGHAVALLMPFDDDDLQWYPRGAIPNSWRRLPKPAGKFKKAERSATRR